MKRIAIAGAAALMAVGPVAGTASAAPQRGDFGGSYDRDRDHRNDNDRSDRRDNHRRGERWNQRSYNGYFLSGRWNYGPPPAWAYGRSDFRPGYHQWRRGERLPSYYRTQYRQIDWRRERLRAPPRGYHYVRDDHGEILLIGIATGVILSILLNN